GVATTERPRCEQCIVSCAGEQFLRVRGKGIEAREYLRDTLRLLLSGQVRGEVEHLFRQDRLYPEWNVRDVDAELPERHGLLVGLPAQHVIGNALEHTTCSGELVIEVANGDLAKGCG